jgi:N-acetylated-alpha-linked acidic dipeptidase
MADAEVLPYDYQEYGKEIMAYLDAARKKAETEFGAEAPSFSATVDAARRFEQAGAKTLVRQQRPTNNPARLNRTLRETERALLIPDGLPGRPWFRHSIYAPGRYTGYAAVVIPGVSEAIDRRDLARTREQLAALAAALERAAKVLSSYH